MATFEKTIDTILKNKIELVDSTKSLYKRNLKKLHKELQIKDNSTRWLSKDFNRIKEYIDKLKTPGTKLLYLNSIYKIIESNGKFNKDIKRKYLDLRNIVSRENILKKQDNVIKPSNPASLTLEELKSIPNIKFINKDKYNKLSEKGKIEYLKELTENIFVYIFTNRPPLRLDFYNLPLIYSPTKKPNDINYLYIEPNDMKLHLNVYKTVKSYGPLIQNIDDELYKILKKWFEFYEYVTGERPEFLLYRINNKKFDIFTSKNYFSKYIKNIFNKYIGAPITINIIRKIYETDFINSDEYKNMSNSEREKYHEQMLHSGRHALEDYNKLIRN